MNNFCENTVFVVLELYDQVSKISMYYVSGIWRTSWWKRFWHGWCWWRWFPSRMWSCSGFRGFFCLKQNWLLTLLYVLWINLHRTIDYVKCTSLRLKNGLKLWSETNRTTLGFDYFTIVSGHFFTNYINSFHKNEDLTVILRCLETSYNLN